MSTKSFQYQTVPSLAGKHHSKKRHGFWKYDDQECTISMGFSARYQWMQDLPYRQPVF
jgi:hypothetical protein